MSARVYDTWVGTYGGQKRVSDSSEAELQSVVSHPT